MTLRWWPLFLVLALALAACGGGDKAQTPEPSATPEGQTTAAPTAVPSPTTTPIEWVEGVFVAPADGSGTPVKLADDGEAWGWSPDGTLVAVTTLDPDQTGCLVSSMSCFRDISLVPTDGRTSTVDLGSGSSPTWSADGKSILFYRLVRGPIGTPPGPTHTGITTKEIRVADAATGASRVLASMGPSPSIGDSPSWSPDESRILFGFGNEAGANSLYVVRASGSGPPVRLADGSTFAADWSPDSQRIAYSCGDYVCIVTVDGSEPPRQLVPAHEPDWSPDGSRIAVEVGSFPDFEVWLIDPQTGQGGKLAAGQLPDLLPQASVWSPDGSQVLYQAEGDIYVVGLENGAVPAKLGEGEMPVWSPDGERVAFRRMVGEAENVAGAYQLLVVNADGSGLTTLADDLVPACVGYSWSPDSRRIAFSSFECPLI
jgi:Tol biopolymer transport system component